MRTTPSSLSGRSSLRAQAPAHSPALCVPGSRTPSAQVLHSQPGMSPSQEQTDPQPKSAFDYFVTSTVTRRNPAYLVSKDHVPLLLLPGFFLVTSSLSGFIQVTCPPAISSGLGPLSASPGEQLPGVQGLPHGHLRGGLHKQRGVTSRCEASRRREPRCPRPHCLQDQEGKQPQWLLDKPTPWGLPGQCSAPPPTASVLPLQNRGDALTSLPRCW